MSSNSFYGISLRKIPILNKVIIYSKGDWILLMTDINFKWEIVKLSKHFTVSFDFPNKELRLFYVNFVLLFHMLDIVYRLKLCENCTILLLFSHFFRDMNT